MHNNLIQDATHFVLFEKKRTRFFEEILKFLMERIDAVAGGPMGHPPVALATAWRDRGDLAKTANSANVANWQR